MASSVEILEFLMERSRRQSSEYAGNVRAPELEIPGQLAHLLDDLFEAAGHSLSRTTAQSFGEVVELGIVAWYKNLSTEERGKLGLADSDILGDASDAGDANQLKLSLAQSSENANANDTPRDDIDDSGDPSPAAAQQQADAYAYQSAAYGYTPMTIHALGDGKDGRSSQKNQPRHQKKKRRPAPDTRRKRNRGGSGGTGGGGRRR